MAGDSVHLQFTQDDRDLLLRIDGKLDGILEKNQVHHQRLGNHNRRLARLERRADGEKGERRALKWIWTILIALAGLVGWHINAGGKP